MAICRITQSIMHNGKMLKDGDYIELEENTAQRFEKVGGVVKRKETIIKELQKLYEKDKKENKNIQALKYKLQNLNVDVVKLDKELNVKEEVKNG